MTVEPVSRTSPMAAALLLIVVCLLLMPLGGLASRAMALVSGQEASVQAADTGSDQVGATAAQFRVDESGAATYSIPIYTMPGTAGVVPAVTLSYSSQGGYGAMGKGWSIGGLSMISRCRATREAGDFIVDGVPTDAPAPRPVNFTATDRYCLDGQRLLAAQSGNAACPAVAGMTSENLRTEIDSFQRVCGYTPSGGVNGPAFFTVDRKDGSTSWYGDRDSNAAANRPGGYFESTSPSNPAAALSWAQTRFQDSTGNYINYTYLENPAGAGTGEQLINEIRYTGKTVLAGQSGVASAPYVTMIFNYSARPTSQWGTGYASGGKLSQTRRLDSITVQCLEATAGCAVGDQARHYQFSYGASASGSGLDVLTSVQECRDSGRSVCLRPTTFGWSTARNEFSTRELPANLAISTDKFRGYKLADVNGDGRQDFVYLRENSSTCATDIIIVGLSVLDAYGTATFQFQPDVCLPASIRNRGNGAWHLFDYNGDGRDDLFVSGAAGQGWLLFPSNGTRFDSSQNLIAGLSPAVPSQESSADQVQLADLNGDGLTDIVYPSLPTAPDKRLYARVMQRSGQGYGWASERIVAVDESTLPRLSDDPRCSPDPSKCSRSISQSLSTKSGFNQLADFNGDSASDLLIRVTDRFPRQPGDCSAGSPQPYAGYVVTYGGPDDDVRPPGCGSDPISSTSVYLMTVRSATADTVIVGGYGSFNDVASNVSYGDVNGDGLTDILYMLSVYPGWQYQLNTGTGLQAPASLPAGDYDDLVRFADVNGDGRTDMLRVVDGNGFKSYHAAYALPSGGFSALTALPGGNAKICEGSNCDQRLKSPLFGDFDGDGALDFMSIKLGDQADMYVSRSLTRFVPRDVITSIVNGLGARTDVAYSALTNKDIYKRQSGSRNTKNWGRGSPVMDVLAPSYVVSRASSSSPQAANPTAMATLYYRYANAKVQSGGRGYLGFQRIDTIDPNESGGYVVTTTNYAQYYPYIGVPVQTTKLAVVGQTYAVPACLTGAINDGCFSRPGDLHADLGGQYFSDSIQTWEADSDVAGSANTGFSPSVATPLQVRTLGSEEKLRDPFTGEVTSKVLTTFSYGAYGNVTQTSVDTFSTGASVLTASVVTGNTYAQDNPDRWRLGRLTTSIVTHSRPGQLSIARRTDFAYSTGGPFTGLLTEERTESGGGSQMDLRKQYGYDEYGNRTSVAVCSAEITACGGSVSFQPNYSPNINRYSSVSYGWNGRYPSSKTELFWNGSSASPVVTQTMQAYDIFGQPVQSSAVNGGEARALSGSLGRAYYGWSKSEPNGAYGSGSGIESLTTYRWCTDVSCPAGTTFRQKTTTTAAPTQWTYFDVLGRPVMKAAETFNLGVIDKDVSASCTDYDATGKARRVSNPFFVAGTGGTDGPANLSTVCSSSGRAWAVTTYDILGRPIGVLAADMSSSSMSYSGLTTGMTDPRGKTTNQLRNGRGELVQTVDANGLSLTNVYDAAGNVIEVHRDGGRGDIVNKFTYDRLGRKTAQDDPDAGDATFTYNPAGELIEQFDANDQSIRFSYDARGRMWKKTVYGVKPPGGGGAGIAPVETTTTTVYDTAANGIGQIASESITGQYGGTSGPTVDFARSYAYDGLGRSITVNTTIDGTTYPGAVQYDARGRPYKVQDASTQWAKVEYTSRGPTAMCFSSATDTVPDCSTIAWQRTQETDAWGHTVREVRSASGQLPLTRTYNALNGRLEGICGDKPGSGGACDLIDEQYRWDAAGNLTSHQKESRYLEGFDYDNLSRLKTGTLLARNGMTDSTVSQAFQYDALGNLCRKTSLGVSQDYSYLGRSGCGTGGLPGSGTSNPFGPSQVSGVSGNAAHYYDAEGNLTLSDASGTTNDRYVSYTADGKPWQVAMESATAPSVRTRFWYGTDGQRYKAEHSDIGETVLYIGSVEIQKIGGTTAYRRNIGGFLIQRWVGSTNTNYFLWHDQLGSLVRMTDPLGTVTDSMDFSAYGERKSTTSPVAAGGGPNNSVTRKGFTGHEQFGRINIVHMNGRIYDPTIGRFMQADPMVQAPGNAQSWNAYTYVFNNPLAYTDPTGMLSARQWLGLAIAVVASYFTGQYWIAQNYWAAFGVAVAGGFASGYVSTGTLQGGVTGAFTAAVTFGVGFAVRGLDIYLQVAAQATAGGILQELQGGKFGNGFVSAGLTAAFMPQVGKIGNDVGRTVTGAIVGGTISEATGGKFANGAISGAIQAAMAGGAQSRRGVAADGAADGVANSKIARAATTDANIALGDALKTTYSSLDDAALAWSDAVLPVAEKYGAEIGSMLFEMDSGKYRIGSAVSSGARDFVEVRLGGDVSWGTLVGYAHTHPSNRTFSGADMDIALQFHRDSGVHSSAYVALPNKQVWAWSTSDWAARAYNLPSSWDSLRTLQRKVR